MNSNSILKLESVSKSFSAEAGLKTDVLKDINFEIPLSEKPSFTSILAPFGSGKSTLMKIISGLLEPSGGNISINDIHKNKKIPYIPEKPSSFPWLSVSQNIEIGLNLSENKELKLNQLISLVGLSGYENHFPHNKSIGFRFRISLARAIAVNPSLILIDDSFRLMRRESRQEIFELLMELSIKQKLNFIVATTNLIEAILLSDNIILMSKKPGKIIKIIDIDKNDEFNLKALKSEKFTTLRTQIEAAFEEAESLTTINYSV